MMSLVMHLAGRQRTTLVALTLVSFAFLSDFIQAQLSGKTTQLEWKIVFDSARDGHGDIYLMDSDGSNQHRLTFTKGERKESGGPAWSPDRRTIAKVRACDYTVIT